MPSGSWKCRDCNAYNDDWLPRCPRCGLQGGMVEYDWGAPQESAVQERGVFAVAEDFKDFDGRRVSTGIRGFDLVLGKNEKTGETGLHLPSTVVLGGAQGLGKTALLLEAAASIVRSGTRFAFCSSEQHPSAIRTAIIRLGLDDDLRRMNLLCTNDFGVMLAKLREGDIRVAFIDSINKFIWPEMDTNDVLNNKVRMMSALVAEMSADDKKFRSFVVISHLNADDRFTGKRELLFDVDATAMLSKGYGTIELACSKNRLAATDVKAHFRMNDVGKMVEVTYSASAPPPVESGALVPATTVVAPSTPIEGAMVTPLTPVESVDDIFEAPQVPIADLAFEGLLARRRKRTAGALW